MTTFEIPSEVREFVLKYALSVGYVEGLMLLRQAPEKWWDNAALADRLYISADEAENLLQQICRDSFAVEQDGRYRFDCASAELAGAIDGLQTVYRYALIPLTHLIHSNRPSRVQEFANAFKLRKRR